MSTPVWNNVTRLFVGSVLLSTVTFASTPVQAQSPGDIVVIGDHPSEWSQFQSFWNQLLNLRAPAPAKGESSNEFSQGGDPQKLAQDLMKNLKVSKLRLEPIIRLNGSSMASGTITNNNNQAVRVSSVNFEVLDGNGTLLSTGSAAPEPATIEPGQTVTFSRELLTTPPDPNYKIRLSKTSPFTLQGGV